MRTKRGNIVGVPMSNKAIETVFRGVMSKVTKSVFADEDPTSTEPKGDDNSQQTQTPPSPALNFEDLIQKARKEEKDKLYPKITALQTQVNKLTEQHNTDLLTIADLEGKLEEAQKVNGGDESEAVKTLKGQVATLEKEKKDLEKKVKDFEKVPVVDENELRTTIEQEFEAKYKVKEYRMEQLSKHKDDIFTPELVIGNTNEEIDASIQREIERSNEIKSKLGYTGEPTPPANNQQRRTPRTPSNPSVSRIQDSQLDLNRLATMDVRSPEYAELRKQLGLR